MAMVVLHIIDPMFPFYFTLDICTEFNFDNKLTVSFLSQGNTYQINKTNPILSLSNYGDKSEEIEEFSFNVRMV